MKLVTPVRAGIVLIAIVAACESSTLTPGLEPTISVTIVGGDAQSGIAGTELPQPLKVKVVDAAGKVRRGELVNFKVKSGGGEMYAGAALSDQQGYAQDWWTLGPTLGTQTVEVVAVDPTTGAKMNFGTFSATALAPAQLQVTPVTHGFGSVVTGSSSPAQAFQVTNIGGVPSGAVGVTVGGTDASDFQVSGDACSGTTLAAGASCTFSVTFTPGATGARSGNVTASAAPGGSVQSTLTGTGAAPANLIVTPGSHNFGTIGVGSTSPQQFFNVVNNGGGVSGIISAAIVGTDPSQFTIVGSTCAGQTLLPGGACVIGVAFQPTGAGGKSAALSVTASPGGAVGALLSGTAVVPATLTASPASLDFGSAYPGLQTVAQSITITNTGGGTTGVLNTSLASGDFFITAPNTCTGATLAPGANCTISVYFRPTTIGARSASLMVSGAVSGSVAVPLAGSGSPTGDLLIVPSAHNYGTVALGTTTPTQSFLVQNTAPGIVGGLQFTLGGANASDFLIVPGGTCTGLSALSSTQSCTILVSFRPTATGARSGSLTASTLSPVLSSSATLSGSGNGALLSVTPASHNFGSLEVGSTSPQQAFSVSNVGNVTSGPITIGLTGTHSADFTAGGTCGAPLTPGASCQVFVTFTPSATGTRSAAVTASASPGGSDGASLLGTGTTATPSLGVSPSTHSYGSVAFGTNSASRVFTVQNTGGGTTSPVTVGLVGTDAAHFDITTETCSLATLSAGATCSVTVVFNPGGVGPRSAQLSATATTGGVAVANLSGTGVAPANLIITPPGVAFGNVPIGSIVGTTFLVTNTGGAVSGPLAPSITGPGAAAFSIRSSTCAGPLNPSASCQIEVLFQPTAGILYSATLSVNASPGGPAAAALSGTGTP